MSAPASEPVVSVVLPVYNCAQYVAEAVQSILDQTFPDFEFIIINDGSTDATANVLQKFRDPRIRSLTQENRGLAFTLNRGLQQARGRYVARQDADDISLPERLGKQVAFLEAHPACALVGTWADIWRAGEPTGRSHHHPSDNATLKFELLFNNPFVHSSVMLHRTALDQVGGYAGDSFPQTGDYELWSRIARLWEVANIPEVLQIYREVAGSLSRVSDTPIVDQLVNLSAANLAWASGTDATDPDVINLAAMVHAVEGRVIGKRSFRTMGEILRRAVNRVVPEENRGIFEREANRRINGLRLRYALAGWL